MVCWQYEHTLQIILCWRCIKRRCIIRRWKDLRHAAYSFWYLIEKSLVFSWLWLTIQDLSTKIPRISVAAKGTKKFGLQVCAKRRYAKHALKVNLQVSFHTCTELGSRSDFAISSWNSSMSLSSIPGFDWQQDETWQRTTRVFLRGFILKVFVAKEHAFAWCASRMGASRRLPGHPARGVVRLTCFITHIRPPCQIGCVTERLLIRFGVCCCCCWCCHWVLSLLLLLWLPLHRIVAVTNRLQKSL